MLTTTKLRVSRRDVRIPAVTLVSRVEELLDGSALGKNESDDDDVYE